jgi:hypothetical protein
VPGCRVKHVWREDVCDYAGDVVKIARKDHSLVAQAGRRDLGDKRVATCTLVSSYAYGDST